MPDTPSGNIQSPINEKRRYKRRCRNHDYRAPAIYMITLNKAPDAPTMSSVNISDGGIPYCDYTPLGFIILNQFKLFNTLHPEAKISNHVIMPDHIHFIIQIKEPLKDDIGLGRLIAGLKSGIRKQYHERFPDSPIALAGSSPIERWFNDMILFREGQLDNMIRYIKDNPRRHMIKKRFLDLFTTSRRIMVNGKEYSAIGNIFLLKNPELKAVRFSRKITGEEWEKRIQTYRSTIANGGVLISPFILTKEKPFFDEALAYGAGAILIHNRLYGERDKPAGKHFDQCAAGKLLILAPIANATPPPGSLLPSLLPGSALLFRA